MNLSLRLLAPIRRLVEPPEKLISWMGVERGMKVADIGCGPGYLAIPLARSVGNDGRVYAIDVDEKAAEYLEESVKRLGLRNVEVRVAAAESLDGLPDDHVDLSIMLHSLHHFSDKEKALREAYRITKPGGRLVIIEPIKERMLGHGTNINEVSETLSSSGFRLETSERRLLTYRIIAWKD